MGSDIKSGPLYPVTVAVCIVGRHGRRIEAFEQAPPPVISGVIDFAAVPVIVESAGTIARRMRS
jgi:hypothetical protein